MQSKNAKRRKFDRSTKWLSGILDIFWFDPQNLKKTIFENIIAYRILNFYVIKKTEYTSLG